MKTKIAIAVIITVLGVGCENPQVESHGVVKATADVPVNERGLTVEQENITNRLLMDNQPGSIKHLYVISAMSGQVLIYSTVKGKVTSSGKKLTPATVASNIGQYGGGARVTIRNEGYYTSEVLQDDGTYGSSIDYLYWWDQGSQYHQHYVTGGQILHISDKPIAVRSIVLNLETSSEIQESAKPINNIVEHNKQ